MNTYTNIRMSIQNIIHLLFALRPVGQLAGGLYVDSRRLGV